MAPYESPHSLHEGVPYVGQPRLPGQIHFNNKELAFHLSHDGVGLEDMRSLARSRYPVTPHTSHPPKVPLPQKVELGPELSLWTPVPISLLLPLLVLGQCQARRGGWSCSLGLSKRSYAHWFWVPAWDHHSLVDKLTLSRHISAAALGGRVPVTQRAPTA